MADRCAGCGHDEETPLDVALHCLCGVPGCPCSGCDAPPLPDKPPGSWEPSWRT